MAAAFVLGEVYAAGYEGIGVLGFFLFTVVLLFLCGRKGALFWGAALFVCALLGGYRFSWEEGKRCFADKIETEEMVEFRGRVDWVKETGYGASLMLSDAELRGEERKKLTLFVNLPDASGILPGDRIQAKGHLEEFERAKNPGEFDNYLYYRSLGCHYACTIDSVVKIKPACIPILRILAAVRERLREVYRSICTETTSGIYQAMLLGEKEELPTDIKELYSESGISHILAISGLHIAVLGMGLYHMLRRIGGFSFSGLTAGAVISLYVLMTGSAVSARRACIMFLIQLLSYMLKRSYDMLSAAAAAMLILLWQNPWYLFNSGFQLSFSAVFAVGMLNPLLSKFFEAKTALFKAFLSSASVSLATFPVLAWSFYEISPCSILLNLIVIPCMTLVMLSGLLGGMAGLFHPYAGRFFVALGQYILLLYENLCRLSRLLPGNQLITGKPPFAVIVLYYLILAAFLLLSKQQSRLRISALAKRLFFAVLLFFLPAILTIRGQSGFYVCFLYVSQGDGIYMETPDGFRMLVDGGSSDKRNLYTKSLLPFLKARGARTLDCAVVTHPDEDHVSALKELMKDGTVKLKRLLLPKIDDALEDEAYLQLLELARHKGILVGFLSQNDTFNREKLSVVCLHPYQGLESGDRNGYSTVLEVSYKDFSMLLTGDLDEAGESYLVNHVIKERKHYTILKVAHHGSKYSTTETFLDKITAKYAVISCGKRNRYGHPHKETLQRLTEAGSKVLITAEMGAVEWEEK